MRSYIKNTLSALLMATVLLSCTKNFEDLNTNKTKISTVDNATLEYLFSAAQYRGVFGLNTTNAGATSYQRFSHRYSDAQAQYFANTSQSAESDRNVMVGSWLDYGWVHFYSNANAQLSVVMEQTKDGGPLQDPIKHAIAKVWKVYMFMPVTDNFGAIPYFQAGNGETEVMYDSQEDIYNDFFKLLKEANATLSAYSGPTKFFEKGDLIYGGDVKKWTKFCNSLWLRAAIRVSKKAPALGKQQAEAAVAAAGGMIITNADNAFMKVSSSTPNLTASISSFNEFRMSAAMESVLKGYNDPRLQKFFDPTSSGTYKGIRNGLSQVQLGIAQNAVANNSNINSSFGFANRGVAPWKIFTASETLLLLAEAKLNNWNTGSLTVQTYYQQGIDASMAQWGVTDASVISTYKAGTTTPAALGDIYSTPGMVGTPVAFGSTEPVQREQIATQKWLALYPYGQEAWAEVRRTGFPRLYPRLNSDNIDAPASDPTSIKRLTYPPIEASSNANGLASGIAKLGGPDKVTTKLWWNP
ncbi:SusD/RagB family nutrient-binding outer membrane lipoprotein [Pedobacter arcticus]|uniref:SusD/RagB family nutrient-binding outer membrane lipoprotein n=1 Tax=Pedobacter arcticus TaxID=752140 RepID=UPI000373260E|nr:SusD/RagB family nutrient-binding outer membrane lipoprotein [Pedobacter arcticus]